MRRIYILLLCFLASSASLFSAPVDSLFLSAPRHVVPLPASDTLHVLSRTARSLRVAFSSRAEVEMAVFTAGGRELRATLTTLRLPAADTEVRFWDEGWREVPAALPRPVLDDFLVPSDSLSAFRADELRRLLDPLHVAWTWREEAGAFDACVSLDALPDFERRSWQNHLRERLFSPEEMLNWHDAGRKTP